MEREHDANSFLRLKGSTLLQWELRFSAMRRINCHRTLSNENFRFERFTVNAPVTVPSCSPSQLATHRFEPKAHKNGFLSSKDAGAWTLFITTS